MAVIKVRDPSSGEVKQFNIKGDTPTDTEKQKILSVLQQTPRLGQLKGLEQAGEPLATKMKILIIKLVQILVKSLIVIW